MRVLVIGGSVGGLMAGCLFRKAGCDVAVYERAVGDLAGRGAGLGVSRELLDVMARAGARFEASAGVAQSAHVWMERDGSIAYEHRRNLMASAWARVYQPLRAALPSEIYRQGMTLERIEDGSAVFADGTREKADLIVAADGVYSAVRKQFLPNVQPRLANYVAWRGLVEESLLPQATLGAVSGRIVFCFPQGEMLLSMRVPGAVYFIWYRSGSLQELFTDA
ncbi:MAG TPA: FAD-dependent monooxygenase, partial [Burkholderiales bacterium]|nr:FAD-dependent monooxygenase [Burkholderiales bacterium]